MRTQKSNLKVNADNRHSVHLKNAWGTYLVKTKLNLRAIRHRQYSRFNRPKEWNNWDTSLAWYNTTVTSVQGARRNDMLAPLTALVRECGQTKVTRAFGLHTTHCMKMSWNLSNNKVHQRAFDHVKATIAREVVLAYPDYSEVFEIYTMLPVNN